MNWRAVLGGAALTAGVTIGIAFGLSLIIGLLASGAVDEFDSAMDLGVSIGPELVVGTTLAQIFGAPLELAVSLFGEFSGELRLRPVTLTLLVAICCVLAAVIGRNRGFGTAQVLPRVIQSIVAGGFAAIALPLIVTLCINSSTGTGFSIGLLPAAFQAFLLVGICHFVGTTLGSAPPASGTLPRIRRDANRPRLLGEVGVLALAYLAAGAVITVGLIIRMIIGGSDGMSSIDPTGSIGSDSESAGSVRAGLLIIALACSYAVNGLVAMLAVAQLSSVQWTTGFFGVSTGQGSGSFGVLGSESSGWIWLGTLVLLLTLALASLRIGLRRPPSERSSWARAWQLPVLWAAIWLVLQLISSARLTIGGDLTMGGSSAEGDGGVHLGPATFTFLVAGLWALPVEVGARFLPTLAYGVAPGLASALAGRSASAPPGSNHPNAPTQSTTHTGWTADTSTGPDESAEIDHQMSQFGVTDHPVGPAPGATPQPGAAEPPPGTALPGPAGNLPDGHTSQPDPAGPPVPAMSPQARRTAKLVLGLGGALVAVVVLAAVVVAVINSTRTPEAAAEQYVQLIADGNAEAANALVPPDVPDAERGLLTDEVLAAATRIDNVRARPATSLGDDDSHSVLIDYGLGGRSEQASLTVIADGKDFGLFDRWRVITPLTGYLMVVSPGTASVDGVDVDVILPDSDYTVPGSVAYPGIYTVDPGPVEYYDPPEPQQGVVLPMTEGHDDPVEEVVQFSYTPNQQLVDAVNAEVGDWLEECLRTGEDRDSQATYSSNCTYGGNSVPGYYYPEGEPEWTVDSPPSMALSPEDSTGSFFSGEATVSVSYVQSSFSGDETVEETITVSIDAIVQPAQGDVDVRVNNVIWTPN